eukprot:m.61253 g.61253  ORF g.61253 m.61253 type:complete len:110 (+) comp13868_c3_seq7:2017-2346(+)
MVAGQRPELCVRINQDDQQRFNALVNEATLNRLGTVTLDTVKLLLVGSGGVGKTTLLKSLAGVDTSDEHASANRTNPEERTRGVNLVPLELSGCKFVAWDYAGQMHTFG